MTTVYDKLKSRKRTWTPVRMTAGSIHPEAHDVVLRALSLRSLELPVGDFITQACRREIPDAARELLLSNVADEERHDIALNYAADVHKPDHYDAVGYFFATEANLHPDHPVLKAMVLERSVFFVILPMFRFLGDAGLRTLSADISRDEQVHVATNSFVCRDLGLTFSDSLAKLRREIVEWVTAPLNDEHPENRYLSRNFWLEQSDSLLYTGKAPGFDETKRARMPAFFEHSNNNLPSYA